MPPPPIYCHSPNFGLSLMLPPTSNYHHLPPQFKNFVCVTNYSYSLLKKQPSENMQQICRRTPIPERCSSVNLLHIFRTPFPKKKSGWLLLLLYPLATVDRRVTAESFYFAKASSQMFDWLLNRSLELNKYFIIHNSFHNFRGRLNGELRFMTSYLDS